MNIGMNIKTWRERNNLKQSDLGKLLNVSNKTISSWEKNRTEPNIGMIEEMCKIFKCQKTDIIDGTQPYLISDKNTLNTIFTLYQSDTEFMNYIQRLWNLPSEYRQSIYKVIRHEERDYQEALADKRKKEEALA